MGCRRPEREYGGVCAFFFAQLVSADSPIEEVVLMSKQNEMIMKKEFSINGQDYSWQGADLYTKPSTKTEWKKIKSYDSNIISISSCSVGLEIETESEIFQADLIGTKRLIITHKTIDTSK